MYCRYCGSMVAEADAFCTKCGKPVKPAPVPVAEAPKPEPEFIPAEIPVPVEKITETAPEETFVAQEPAAKPKKKLWLRILAAALVLVLLASTALVLYTQVFTVELWVLEGAYVYIDGEKHLSYSCEYDKQGRLIEMRDNSGFDLAADSKYANTYTKYTYTYNDYGDCIREEQDLSQSGEKLSLEEHGISLQEVAVAKYKYTYNDDGLKTKKYQVIDGDKRLIETYEYDGDQLERIVWGDEDSGNYKYRKFDKNGRYIEYGEFRAEDPEDNTEAESHVYKYSYDKKGNLVGIKYYKNGEFSKEEELRYDKKRRMMDVINPESGQVLMEYETDKNGNIVRLEGAEDRVFTWEYKKIRVSRKQAQKLIGENCTFYGFRSYFYISNAFRYRIEE